MFALYNWKVNNCVAHMSTRYSARSSYAQRETVSGPTLRRSMRRTKRTGFVAFAIARSHSCLLLTAWDLKGTAHWVRISMWDELWLFYRRECVNNRTHTWNCSAYRELLTSKGSVMHSDRGEYVYIYICEKQGDNSGCCCWFNSSRV